MFTSNKFGPKDLVSDCFLHLGRRGLSLSHTSLTPTHKIILDLGPSFLVPIVYNLSIGSQRMSWQSWLEG